MTRMRGKMQKTRVSSPLTSSNHNTLTRAKKSLKRQPTTMNKTKTRTNRKHHPRRTTSKNNRLSRVTRTWSSLSREARGQSTKIEAQEIIIIRRQVATVTMRSFLIRPNHRHKVPLMGNISAGYKRIVSCRNAAITDCPTVGRGKWWSNLNAISK